MSFKVIILAGGKGTRIKSVLGKIPKILAPINKKTFLDYLIVWIKSWNICLERDIILSTGVGHQAVKEHCKVRGYQIKCIKEEKPLGTFGAIINVARSNFANHSEYSRFSLRSSPVKVSCLSAILCVALRDGKLRSFWILRPVPMNPRNKPAKPR